MRVWSVQLETGVTRAVEIGEDSKVSIVDSIMDAFYEHLMWCPKCKVYTTAHVDPNCPEGVRLWENVKGLENLD